MTFKSGQGPRRKRKMKVLIVFFFVLVTMSVSELHAKNNENRREPVIDIQETSDRLRNHLKALTLTIGERSVRFPENLKKTAEYIESFLQEIELPVHRDEREEEHDVRVAPHRG